MSSLFFIQFKKPSDPGSAILGSSEDTGHPHWVELWSFSWGVTRPVTTAMGREESSSPMAPEIHVLTSDGAAFTGLMRGCASGTHYASVTIEATKDGRVFMRVDLEDVLISSCRTSGGDRGTLPAMEFVLDFGAVKITSPTGTTGPTGTPTVPPAKTKP